MLCNDTLGKSECHLYQVYCRIYYSTIHLGKSECHLYQVYRRIYYSTIHFEEIEQFFGKGVNLVVNFGKK